MCGYNIGVKDNFVISSQLLFSDSPLLEVRAYVKLSLSFDALIGSASASGSLEVKVTIDFYDPYPETSGGLVRSFL